MYIMSFNIKYTYIPWRSIVEITHTVVIGKHKYELVDSLGICLEMDIYVQVIQYYNIGVIVIMISQSEFYKIGQQFITIQYF